MAALPDNIKAYIVQALACYDKPTQVVESVKQEYDVVITRQQVETYDPTKYAGRKLSEKWREVFAATRERFKTEISEIGIANKAFRLRALERLADKAERQKNLVLTKDILRQAAEDAGDVYTNSRKAEVTGAGGAPLGQQPALSPEAIKAIGEVLDREY